jgi:hypothetical protein
VVRDGPPFVDGGRPLSGVGALPRGVVCLVTPLVVALGCPPCQPDLETSESFSCAESAKRRTSSTWNSNRRPTWVPRIWPRAMRRRNSVRPMPKAAIVSRSDNIILKLVSIFVPPQPLTSVQVYS